MLVIAWWVLQLVELSGGKAGSIECFAATEVIEIFCWEWRVIVGWLLVPSHRLPETAVNNEHQSMRWCFQGTI